MQIQEFADPELIVRCERALLAAGYNARFDEGRLTIGQAGYADKSVDFIVRLVSIDGHRLIQFTSSLGDRVESFERVALAVARGNMHCHTVSFSPLEKVVDGKVWFAVLAQAHIYADHFSDAELASMVYLFTRELDDIDNEIRAILLGK